MKKARILMMMLIVASVFTLMPAAVNAAAKPKLSVKKVTIPVKTGKYNNHMMIWLKGTKKKVKWSTSNKKIVQIHKYRNDKYCVELMAKKKGKATITAKVGKKKYKCRVTVTKAKSRKQLTKLISADISTMQDQYITLRNKSKYYLTAYWDFSLYTKEGAGADSDEVSVHLKPNGSVKVAIKNPNQYPVFKFTKKDTFIDYEYHPIKYSCKKKGITEDNYLPVSVTNKSLYKESLYYVTAFFKKDGRIVWAQQKDTKGSTGKNINPGQTRTMKFWLGSVKPEYDTISIQVSRSSGSVFGGGDVE